jgi:hypothetical protein
VSNTVVSDNSYAGIRIFPTATSVKGVISRALVSNNLNGGIIVNGSSSSAGKLDVIIVDTVASNNAAANGILATSAQNYAATTVVVRNSVSSFNFNGLYAATNASILLGHSTVSGNSSYGIALGGGTIFSYGDNAIDGNVNDGTGFLTSHSMH